MSLAGIVAALGGDLYDGGRRANVPAPGHSRFDRSVSLVLSGGRVVVHTFNGADWREVLDHLRRLGLIDTAAAPRSVSLGQAAANAARPASDRDRVAAARRFWNGGRQVGRTLSERHLQLRGVSRAYPGPNVLRHHPEAPVSAYKASSRFMPAMLSAISAPDGELTAVEITYLAPNGRRVDGLRLPRKTVGAVPASSAIRIDPAGPEILVAEGFITTLSATERFGLPGWALMSTRNLRAWSAPEGVRSVLIAADRGADGEASAEVLRARLRRQGLRVRVELPGEPFGDWNEAAAAILSRPR